uniref:ORF 143 protein n=1 Tax=Saccharomyces cerevisiae TaxID=4932 RepID=A2NY32_YEASX|nr:ORF 143 [Saccharomyces cerevisiae]
MSILIEFAKAEISDPISKMTIANSMVSLNPIGVAILPHINANRAFGKLYPVNNHPISEYDPNCLATSSMIVETIMISKAARNSDKANAIKDAYKINPLGSSLLSLALSSSTTLTFCFDVDCVEFRLTTYCFCCFSFCCCAFSP